MALQPEHVTFNSLGTRCAADLYLPGQTPAPALVLGHSGVGSRRHLCS
ncbi:hypothetical protein AB0K48_33340 [Nonomuraea sp. NPDC055795]